MEQDIRHFYQQIIPVNSKEAEDKVARSQHAFVAQWERRDVLFVAGFSMKYVKCIWGLGSCGDKLTDMVLHTNQKKRRKQAILALRHGAGPYFATGLKILESAAFVWSTFERKRIPRHERLMSLGKKRSKMLGVSTDDRAIILGSVPGKTGWISCDAVGGGGWWSHIRLLIHTMERRMYCNYWNPQRIQMYHSEKETLFQSRSTPNL